MVGIEVSDVSGPVGPVGTVLMESSGPVVYSAKQYLQLLLVAASTRWLVHKSAILREGAMEHPRVVQLPSKAVGKLL